MSNILMPRVPIRPGLSARCGDIQAHEDIHARVRREPDGSGIVIQAVTWDAAEAAAPTGTASGETAVPSPGLGGGGW